MIATTTTTILHTLLASLLLLILSPSSLLTSALPITSKPIESTAENLAWQAWLMLPPEQKSLEKSRKVTPKSIFTLPFRECPPGHQLFENRCIPTLHIDPTALLHQQLLELVAAGGDNANANYENYDYDDEELVLYDTPPMFSGGMNVGGIASSSSYDDASQLPSKDEPLKFNIFQQKFPTDYEADMPSSSSSHEGGSSLSASQVPPITQDNRTNTLLQGTEFLEVVKGFLQRHSNATGNNNSNSTTNAVIDGNSTINNSSSAHFDDLQSESSNFSANFVANIGDTTTSTTAASTDSATTSVHSFSVSDIDAIALPATAQATGFAAHKPHKFSLFKDDSAIQLVTTVISERNNNHHNDETTQPDLAQLLKADALLPLGAPTVHEASNAEAIYTATTTTTTTTTNSHKETAAGIAQPLQLAEDEVTGMTPLVDDAAAELTTTLRSELLADAAEPQIMEPEKSEHTRSVTMRNTLQEIGDSAEFLEAEEDEFSTTLEPDATTNFQLDETTIIETHDPPAIVQQELEAAAAQHPQEQALKRSGSDSNSNEEKRENHVALEKSKVEPVQLVVGKTTAAATTTTATATVITTTKTTTAATTSTPLPTVSESVTATETTMATQDDRFYYQHLGGVGVGVEDSNQQQNQQQQQQRNVGNVDNNDGNDADYDDSRSGSNTKPATSEINIEQELRMINELVKGNSKRRQVAATLNTTPATKSTTAYIATQTATTTAASSAAAAESSFTAETVETETTGAETERSASVNKENVDGDVDVATTTQSSLTTLESGSAAEASSEAAAETTAATAETAETTETTEIISTTSVSSNEPTATLWSKIMPILGFGSATTTTAQTIETTFETTEQTAQILNVAAAEKERSSTTSESKSNTNSNNNSNTNSNNNSNTNSNNNNSINSSINSSISINSNRSNRNSKIRRINSQSANSIASDSSSSKSSNHVASSSETPTTITTTTTTTATATTAAASASASTEATTNNSSSETATENSDAPFEPFWWLPVGWRLDRNASDADQSLLLRFWSAFPGNQTKVKK